MITITPQAPPLKPYKYVQIICIRLEYLIHYKCVGKKHLNNNTKKKCKLKHTVYMIP